MNPAQTISNFYVNLLPDNSSEFLIVNATLLGIATTFAIMVGLAFIISKVLFKEN